MARTELIGSTGLCDKPQVFWAVQCLSSSASFPFAHNSRIEENEECNVLQTCLCVPHSVLSSKMASINWPYPHY